MHCWWLCRNGRALRRGSSAVLVVTSLILFSACKPDFGTFLPANAFIKRTFGQLFVAGTDEKLSHFVVVKMPPVAIMTVTSGTMEYAPDFHEMGHCVIVRPQKYPLTKNDFSNLHSLPSPSSIRLAYCNLIETSVHEAARVQYMRLLPHESSGDWIAAANHFIAGDSGFRQIDIRNHNVPFPISDEIGRANNDELFFAAFKQEGDKKVFVNPLPYMAAAMPALQLDPVPPTFALTSVVVQTSASDFKNSSDIVEHTVAADGSIATPLPRHPMRIAIQSTERASTAGPLIVPYAYRSRIELVSGTPVVRSRGAALFNSFKLDQGQDLRELSYEPDKSDPATDKFFPVVAWNKAHPAPAAGEEFFNALTLPGSFSLDLNAIAGGNAVFPGGQYRLVVTVADVAQAAVEQTITFQLEPALEMQILQDSNPDNNDFTDNTQVVDSVRIGLWEGAYDSSEDVLNGPGMADSFIGRDRFRFFVRIRDPNANTSSAQETVTAKLGVFEDGGGLPTDNLTDIELIESASEPGVFVSRSQLLTSLQNDLDALPSTCPPGNVGSSPCEDDHFHAHSGGPAGPVADDQPGDRTHQARIEDHVRIEYVPAGSTNAQLWKVPVCQRNPDQRRRVLVRVTVFDNLVDEAKVAAELHRATIGWAPACLRIDQEGVTQFVSAPLDSNGISILADNVFDDINGSNPQAPSDERVVFAQFKAQARKDVIEVFVVPKIDRPPNMFVNGFARLPRHSPITQLGDYTFLYVVGNTDTSKRTLAHEIGHALENGGRDNEIVFKRDFYPQVNFFTDQQIRHNRRISWQTIGLTTRVRTSQTDNGNRLMKPLQ